MRPGHDAFQSKDPVVEGCLVRQWREMNELCLSRVWVSLLTSWSEDLGSSPPEEHTPSSNEDLMEGVVSAEDNDAVKEAGLSQLMWMVQKNQWQDL